MNQKAPFYPLPPLSLYVHIPWCIRKCPYCDFNSHTGLDAEKEKAYVTALAKDLEQDLSYVQNRKLSSIFFGGGTPSLFSANTFEQLIDLASNAIGFEDRIEITLEANPGTFEHVNFSDFKSAGINRLSIGIQSFSNQNLETLGRIHQQSEAIAAANSARQQGLNVNLDIMHGLPGQSVDGAIADIDTALELSPDHISWYQLTIEKNTEFYRAPPELPNETILDAIQTNGLQRLQHAGFGQYEISAFAKPGKQSKHNLNYWQFGDYIGIGAGAHGKITCQSTQQIFRTQKTRQPDHYLNKEAALLSHTNPLSSQELPLEFMMNALRLIEGVPAILYEQRTGLPLLHLEKTLEDLTQHGLMKADKERLCVTPLGGRFLNDVLNRFD